MTKIIIITLVFFFSGVLEAKGHPKNKKYNISICSIFKNEAKYLKEWIEFHRLVGVDHFYLYNIESTDRYRDVLKNYIREGVVTLIHWPDLSKNQSDEIWALGMQIPAYENAVKYTAIKDTKWLVFVDIDEFLLPIDGNNLSEVVEKYKDYPGILLSRIFFDASRVDTLPRRNLVIESIEMTSPPKQNSFKFIEKMLFKPELCSYFTWPPYTFAFQNDQAPVKLNKWEMRINRYIDRNIGSLNSKKVRGLMQMDYRSYEDEVNELLQAGYEIEEHTIDRFVPALKRKLGL